MSRQPRTTPRKSHRFELDLDDPDEKALHLWLVKLGNKGKASEWIKMCCMTEYVTRMQAVEDSERSRHRLEDLQTAPPLKISPGQQIERRGPVGGTYGKQLPPDDDEPTYEPVEE